MALEQQLTVEIDQVKAEQSRVDDETRVQTATVGRHVQILGRKIAWFTLPAWLLGALALVAEWLQHH